MKELRRGSVQLRSAIEESAAGFGERSNSGAPEQAAFRASSYIGWLLVFKLCLDVVYPVAVAPYYSYFGLVYNPDTELAILVIFLQILLSAVAPRDKRRPSTYLFLLLQLMVFIPAFSFAWLAGGSSLYALALFASGILTALIIRAVRVDDQMRVHNVSGSAGGFTGVLALIFVGYVGGSALIIASRGGIDPRALGFEAIYELRAENSIKGLAGYWYNWCTKAFFPFFLGYILTRNRTLAWRFSSASVVVTIQIAFYLSFGFKAFLFSIALACIVAFGVRSDRFIPVVVGGVSLLTIVSPLAAVSSSLAIVRDTVVVRTLFLPAQIQFEYFDWFSQNEYLYFTETLFGRALGMQSPYPEGISFRIGAMYSEGGSGVNANTAVFSDGFANGGLVVMLLTAAVLGLMFLAIDFVGSSALLLTVVSFSYFTFTLNDTSLTTALLTGGYVVILGLVYLARRQGA